MDTFSYTQKTFDELYGTLPVPVLLFDTQFKIVKANHSFLELSKNHTTGLPELTTVAFFKDHLPFLSDRKTLFEGLPNHVRTEITCSGGEVIPIELNYKKFAGKDKSFSGCIVFISDLREVRAAQKTIKTIALENEALKEQLSGKMPGPAAQERSALKQFAQEAREILENVVESCGDGVIIAGGDGRITHVNEAFLKTVNKDQDEIIRHKFYELGPIQGDFISTAGETIHLDQLYVNQQLANVEKIMQSKGGGKLQNWLWYAFHKNGQIVPLEVTVSIRKRSAGSPAGFVAIFRDITDRLIAEKALLKADQFRNQFYANITHEFRTPLTLAIGPLEGLLQGAWGRVTSEVKEQLSIAMNNSRQLLKLVNQLLDFSMLESGSKNLIYEKRDLNTFVTLILDSFSSMAKAKKIEIAFNPAKKIPEIFIDPAKMEKVLFNLIGNAFKFTLATGRITVTVSARKGPQQPADGAAAAPAQQDRVTGPRKHDFVKIAISDTGSGIKKEDLDRIFDRFNTGSTSVGAQQGGTGIGLAHAKELIELVGGWIEVKSRYRKGSIFTVYFPLEEVPPDAGTAALGTIKEELYADPQVELSDVYQEDDSLEENISGTRPHVLIVEDNPAVRKYIAGILRNQYDFQEARNGREALKQLKRSKPDLILCDIMMPEMDGHAFLKHVKSSADLQSTPFVFLTAKAETETKLEGLEEGADDYIVKPFNSLELLARIRALLRIRDLMSKTEAQEKKISNLTEQLQGRYSYGNIIGSSPPMRNIYQLLDAVKDSDSTVLITGETGTGKDLIANAIHFNSPRKKGPLISVNCGAIPQELMEREFFGHVKGAYTGAVESRKGYFQEADGGTLFLDEIGEMNKDMQVKLLRVLEQGDIMRVGDSVPARVDVRLIAASNKDLRAEIQKGNFREDLFYRIFVLPVNVPPLRERKQDIPLLIGHFLKSIQSKLKTSVPAFSRKEMSLFMDHDYPGNVRELEYMVERFCLLGTKAQNLFHAQPDASDRLLPEAELLKELQSGVNLLKTAGQKAKARAEREIILQTLKMCNYNHTEAARKLNICRASLYRKLNNPVSDE